MAVTELEVKNLGDLVKSVLKISAKLSSGRFLWFRGLSCGDRELLPKLMRDKKPIGEVFEREARLMTRFRQRSMAYWPAGYPQDDWEHLFAMQHYGLPTRLLDWSENVFVAAYFALQKPPNHKAHNGCGPTVWLIDPIGWNRSMPGPSEYSDGMQVLTTADEHLEPYAPMTKKKRHKSPVAMYGSHNSKRIVAQRGTFVVWGEEAKPLEDHKPGTLWKIRLTGTQKDLFRDLVALGFSETMVFPALTFLADELDRAEGWR